VNNPIDLIAHVFNPIDSINPLITRLYKNVEPKLSVFKRCVFTIPKSSELNSKYTKRNRKDNLICE
jgi:hypothetical protein